MTIEIKRTVSHFHTDDSESVVSISVITYSDGRKSILLRDNGEGSVSIHSMGQAELLIRHIKTVAQEIFE